MTREQLIDVIKEFFDGQLNCGNLAEAPKAVDVADYLIGKGVKVAPLKVGDKVYWINIIDNIVCEYEVYNIYYDTGDFVAKDKKGKGLAAFFKDIDETVFLSRESAEFALKVNRKKHLKDLLNYYLEEKEFVNARQIIRLLV